METAAPPVLSSVPFRFCLKQHCVTRKDKTAVIDGLTGEAVTYGQLHDRVARVAGWLAGHGIGPGDRVACLALNSLSYAEFFFALAWIGAVAVPLNIRLNPKELAFIIEDSGARAIFSCGFMVEAAEAAMADIDAVEMKILSAPPRDGWIVYDELIDPANEPVAMADSVTGETLYMLLYTSGTTGKPKGCMIPQRTWVGYAKNMAACFQMDPEDVYLAFLPFFHVAGFGTAFSQLILGGTIVTAPLPDPKFFFGLIEKHKATVMFLVPGISAAFVYDDARANHDLSSLKTFISGAGGEKLELIDEVENFFGAKYYGIYGQTETGGKSTWADSAMIRQDPSSYGHVMPFYQFSLRDEFDQAVEPGNVGELCLRGESIMLGYWNRPDATAETLKNGWHHTGDMFMLMDSGQVKMVDRKKYLIKTGGENVYPQEVELVLLRHEAVADAAVIGIPDEKWGETVKAFVVLKEGANPSRQALADWVEATIAGYKKPRFVEFVQDLPRNVSGKLLKNELATRQTTDDMRV